MTEEAKHTPTLAEYAHEATKAITGLTVGGSEFFGRRIGEMYTADLPFCVAHIKERIASANDRWMTARKEATTLRTKLAEAADAADATGRDLRNDDATRRGGVYAASLIRSALSQAQDPS